MAATGGIGTAERSEVSEDMHRLVPGAGSMWRKNGRALDKVREAAIQEGYLRPDATVDDLVAALERDSRAMKARDHSSRVSMPGRTCPRARTMP